MQTENNITGAEFLSDLNVLLSTSVGLNRNVKLALKKLGEHERADQVYIVSINHDMTFTISEEWTRTGVFYHVGICAVGQGRNAVSIMIGSWNRI